MRKSNVLIVVILMIASIFFLWLWNFLNFHLIDTRDLIITILWWIITLGLCFAIHRAEKKRRERIRTVYISDGLLYNVETGIYRLNQDDPLTYVEGMCDLLSNLDYDSSDAPDDNKTRLRFNYIVHSSKFSDDGETWKGDVVQVRGPHDAIPFADKEELIEIFVAAKSL